MDSFRWHCWKLKQQKVDPAGTLWKWRRTDVDATSWCRIDVGMTSFRRHVPAGELVVITFYNLTVKQEETIRANVVLILWSCNELSLLNNYIMISRAILSPGGIQTRERFCNNPPTANGGLDCEGPRTESLDCAPEPCRMYWTKFQQTADQIHILY